MEAANDNDTIEKQQALAALLDMQGDALLAPLYGQKLAHLNHIVEDACAKRGRSFETIDHICFSQDEGKERAYLEEFFGDNEVADAFEVMAEFRSDALNFWHAIASQYINGFTPHAEHELDECRGILLTDMWELGGIGSNAAEITVQRVEASIRTAMQNVSPARSAFAR